MIRITLKSLLANRLRFLLTGLAVIIGVAFMGGTLVYSDTLRRGFDDLMANNYAGTDALIRAPEAFESDWGDQRDPVDEAVIDRVLQVDGVRAVEGTVTGYAQLVDEDGKAIGASIGPPTIGVSWPTVDELNPMQLEPGGRPPAGEDEVVIDLRSAKQAGVKVGDPITVLSRLSPQTFTVTGLARWGSAESPLGASVSLFRLDVAQRLLLEPAKVNEIAVVAEPGLSQEALRDALVPLVSELGLQVLTGDDVIAEGQATVREALGFFNTFLLIFALIALFVGSFIIFNTFSIIVAQRTREVALLRAIGASRRQVLGGILLESVVLAAVAAVIGLGAGVMLAHGLRSLLGSFGLDMPGVATQVSTTSLVVAFLSGFVVTVVAAVWPARRAAAIPPLAAMHDVALETTGHAGQRGVTGAALVGAGGAAIGLGLSGSTGSTMTLVGGGGAVVFLGVAVLGPVIARPVVRAIAWPLPRLRGMPGQLARENALRNPKRSSATASALMVGVALVSLITIIAGSAKASIRDTLGTTLRADFVVSTDRLGFGGFSSGLSQKVSLLPEVYRTTGVRFGPAEVAGETHFISGANPRAIEAMWAMDVVGGSLDDLSDTGIAVSQGAADAHGWRVGDPVSVNFARSGVDQFRVEAIFADNDALDDYLLNTHAYNRNFLQPLDMQVLVKLYDGVDPERGRAAIEAVVASYPNANVLDRDEFGDSYAANLDQMLNLVYALLALAIVIALIGIANTLALSIHERTRELGLLRAVGLTRSQLRSVVRWEAVVIALLGAVLGVVVGVAFGWVLVTALADEGITRVAIPVGTLAIVVAIAWLAGIAASVRPGRRAARLDILRAIASH